MENAQGQLPMPRRLNIRMGSEQLSDTKTNNLLIALLCLSTIPYQEYNCVMAWEVEYTDEFGQWWSDLTEGQQDAVASRVELLMEHGPNLPYPYS